MSENLHVPCQIGRWPGELDMRDQRTSAGSFNRESKPRHRTYLQIRAFPTLTMFRELREIACVMRLILFSIAYFSCFPRLLINSAVGKNSSGWGAAY
ncbi:hypothetical protein L211DRAFT_721666 [Terfezia boudieri ATCC MYA-4762]|uniref:Uncharacterized protein n=1 Tax=Terfezia boudieri ATCC MYA-4762 TaxID=1051890 RepID=A0A3N4LAQ3_9PEZI|nr:hypothetical protein L211DRAFT_721666 [Terfezia boudieri ATCC MYA-4762]